MKNMKTRRNEDGCWTAVRGIDTGGVQNMSENLTENMSENLYGMKRTAYCATFTENDIGRRVTVMGWVQKYRNLGGVLFVDLRDRSGILQLTFIPSAIRHF